MGKSASSQLHMGAQTQLSVRSTMEEVNFCWFGMSILVHAQQVWDNIFVASWRAHWYSHFFYSSISTNSMKKMYLFLWAPKLVERSGLKLATSWKFIQNKNTTLLSAYLSCVFLTQALLHIQFAACCTQAQEISWQNFVRAHLNAVWESTTTCLAETPALESTSSQRSHILVVSW